MKHFLGIDCGKTKREALLVDETGKILGWGREGRASEGPARLLDAALREGLPEQLFVGTSGWGKYHLYDTLRKRLPPEEQSCERCLTVRNVTEADAIYAAAGVDYGLIILAGTGSFVEARTHSGAVLHLGGLGPILGDEGSGFEIGLRALRLSFRHWWKGPEWSSLPGAIADTLGLANLGQAIEELDLIRHLWDFKELRRGEIAALAEVVDKQAQAGDSISLTILSAAAASLGEVVGNVISELGIADDDYLFIGAGGVIQGSEVYWNALCQIIQYRMPRCRIELLQVPPVAGAVLYAMKRANIQDTAAIRKRIKQELCNFKGGPEFNEEQEAAYALQEC